MKGPVTQNGLVILKLQKSPGNFYFSERIFYSNQSFAAPTYWLDLRYNDQINAMLTLYRITLAPARKPYRIGLLFTHNNGDLGEISVTDGTLFFFKREAGKFSQANIVFICGSCWKQIFLCLRLPANTIFYLHTIYFSVYTLCKRFISKFSRRVTSPESHIAYQVFSQSCLWFWHEKPSGMVCTGIVN